MIYLRASAMHIYRVYVDKEFNLPNAILLKPKFVCQLYNTLPLFLCLLIFPGQDTNFVHYSIPQAKKDDSTQYFNCPNGCGRRYKHKRHLTAHIKYECGVPRQFHCKMCDKSFTRNFDLKKHVFLRHQIFLWNFLRYFFPNFLESKTSMKSWTTVIIFFIYLLL